MCKRHNIDASLHASCGEPVLPIEHKEALYRITLEAVQNTVRHAQARKVDVTIACEQGESVLTVRDDGKGFDTTARHDGHYGLSTMQERADQLGARIAITSTPGHGVLVSVRVPPGVLPRDTSQPIADSDRSPAPAMAHTQG